MRITGYILLLFGFLWLALGCAGSVDTITRSIGVQHGKKYPDFASYTGSEVREAIESALGECRDRTRGVTLPAALLVIGGILLDLGGRRASGKPASETTSLEGPVELIDGRLTVRIPLAVGGDRLAPYARGMGKIDGEYLNVTIPQRLARKLKITEGSRIAVDNQKGKFNISAFPEPALST